MTGSVTLRLCAYLVAATICLPSTAPADAESTFQSITIESVGAAGRAHKTVESNSQTNGGHLSGMPPRIFRNEGIMTAEDREELQRLLKLLPPDVAGQDTSAPPSYRAVAIVAADGRTIRFLAPGSTAFEIPALEDIYRLLAGQRVGGW